MFSQGSYNRKNSVIVQVAIFRVAVPGMSKEEPMQLKKKNEVKAKAVERAVRLEQLAGQMHLPEEILAKSVRIVMEGQSCIRLENYKAILDYSDIQIKLLSNNGKILIEGKKLEIAYCSDIELCITGNIQSFRYGE